MTRKIAFILLLAIAQPALSAKLYKWFEADGSITFSPTPPAAGVDFEAIGENTDGKTGLKKPANSVRNSNPVAQPPATPRLSAQDLQTPKAAKPASVVNYAPATNSMKQGISRATVQPGSPALQVASTAGASNSRTVVSAQKRKQCADLSKRVVSLERRLRLELSEDDMDNTVIHMARYQTSFNKHCIE
ncbi:MAG: DUF4124 domain-containing protein [Granulosicoccaceae bacterium]